MTQNVTVSKAEAVAAGKTKRVVLHYTSEKTKGQTWSYGALAPQLDKESLDYFKELKQRLDQGGQPELVGIEAAKEGNYWNLKKIGKPDTSTQSQKGSSTNSGTSAGKYDDTGVKVGASRNQAIAFLAATKGTNFTLDDVDQVAYDIVKRQAAQEDNVRKGVNPYDNIAESLAQEHYDADLDTINPELGF